MFQVRLNFQTPRHEPFPPKYRVSFSRSASSHYFVCRLCVYMYIYIYFYFYFYFYLCMNIHIYIYVYVCVSA